MGRCAASLLVFSACFLSPLLTLAVMEEDDTAPSGLTPQLGALGLQVGVIDIRVKAAANDPLLLFGWAPPQQAAAELSSTMANPAVIAITSPHFNPREGEEEAVAIINPSTALALRGSIGTDLSSPSSWTWSWQNVVDEADDTSASAITHYTAGDGAPGNYLFLAASSGLQQGSTYIFRMEVRGNQDDLVLGNAQILIRMNRAPVEGTLSVTPQIGTAVSTSFQLEAEGWSDLEGDLPLIYSFSATADTARSRKVLPLGSPDTVASLETLLPSGSVVVAVQVTDSLGASSQSLAPGLQVAALPSDQQAKLLGSLVTVLSESSSLSSASFYAHLVRTSELSVGKSSRARLLLRALSLLVERSAGSNEALSAKATAAIAWLLYEQLETLAPFTDKERFGVLSTLEAVLRRTTSMSQAMGQAVMNALSSVLETGCGLKEEDGFAARVDVLIDNLTTLVSFGLVEGSEPVRYIAQNIGVYLDRRFMSSAVSPLELELPHKGSGKVLVDAASLQGLRPDLCDSTLISQVVYWARDRHQCDSSVANLPSPSPLPSTGVWSVTLKTACNATAKPHAVRAFKPSSPLLIELPTDPAQQSRHSRRRTLACARGYVAQLEVTCYYEGAQTNSSRQRTVTVECDGVQDVVTYECPVLGTCAIWNESSASWSKEGCVTLDKGAGNDSTTACQCSHLRDFSTVPSLSLHVSQTLVSASELDKHSGQVQSQGILLTLALLYAVFFISQLALRLARRKDRPSYISQLPKTKMFKSIMHMLVSEARRRRIALPTGAQPGRGSWREISLDDSTGSSSASSGGDKGQLSSVTAMADAVMKRRLAKLNQGIHRPQRPPLHQYFMWPSSSRSAGPKVAGDTQGAADGTSTTKGGTVKVAQAKSQEPETAGGQKTGAKAHGIAKVLGGLTSPQQLFLIFTDLLSTLALSIVFLGAPATHQSSQRAVVHLSRGLLVFVTAFLQGLQQNLISDPVNYVLQLLFHVANKETNSRAVVAEELVSRDLPFVPPRSRELSGPLFVPLLRIAITQLELVHVALSPATASAAWDATIMSTATAEQRTAVLQLLYVFIRRHKLTLEQEYYTLCHEQELEVASALRDVKATGHDRLQLKFESMTRPAFRLREFSVNPLEPLEKEVKVARLFDQWVVKQLCSRPATDFLRRHYYQLFIADLHQHVVGQEFFLPSYRLLLCRALLASYVLAVTILVLVLGTNMSSQAVSNTLFSMVAAVVMDELVVSPLLNLLQRFIQRRIVQSLEQDITANKDHFEAWFRYVNEMEETEAYAKAAGLHRGANLFLSKVPYPQAQHNGGRSGSIKVVSEPDGAASFKDFSTSIDTLQEKLSEMDAQYGHVVRGGPQQQHNPLSPNRDLSFSCSLSSTGSSANNHDDPLLGSRASRAGSGSPQRKADNGVVNSQQDEVDALDSSGPLPFVADNAGADGTNPMALSSSSSAAAAYCPAVPSTRPNGGSAVADMPTAVKTGTKHLRRLDSTTSSSSSNGEGRLGGPTLRERVMGVVGGGGGGAFTASQSSSSSGTMDHSGSISERAEEEAERFVSVAGRLTDALDNMSGSLQNLPASVVASAGRALRSAATSIFSSTKQSQQSQQPSQQAVAVAAGSGRSKRRLHKKAPLLTVGGAHNDDDGDDDANGRARSSRSHSGSSSSEDDNEVSSPTFSSTWVQAEMEGVRRELSRSSSSSGGGSKGDHNAEPHKRERATLQTSRGRSNKNSSSYHDTREVLGAGGGLIMARLVPRRREPPQTSSSLAVSLRPLSGSTLSGTIRGTGSSSDYYYGGGSSSAGRGNGGGQYWDDHDDVDAALRQTHGGGSGPRRSNSGGGGVVTALRRRKNSFSSSPVASELQHSVVEQPREGNGGAGGSTSPPVAL